MSKVTMLDINNFFLTSISLPIFNIHPTAISISVITANMTSNFIVCSIFESFSDDSVEYFERLMRPSRMSLSPFQVIKHKSPSGKNVFNQKTSSEHLSSINSCPHKKCREGKDERYLSLRSVNICDKNYFALTRQLRY